jgi:hypothetical protein
MTGERFDRDLRDVLREIAGEEAPMSLRSRLANITEQAPASRRLWFSPPMRLSLAVATVVAVLVLGFFFAQGDEVGPGPSPSEPRQSVDSSATAIPTPTPTAAPSVTPEPTPQVVWSGLDWSAGVTPFTANSSWIADIRPWGEGYVGVGGTFSASGSGQGTVFTSSDGQHWTISYQAELPEGWSFAHLLSLGDGLLAISDQRGVSCAEGSACPPEGFDMSPRLWYSADGMTWTRIDSPSWRAGLGDALPFDVAAGDAGVVAVLYSGSVLHSTDGRTWQRVALPAGTAALPLDVTAFDGGFVVVGRDGDPDPHPQVYETPPPPGAGRPAAWVSANGVDWTMASVDGSVVQGGELREVAAGANGLFAAGIAEPVDSQAHELTHGWASADGVTWTLAGRIGQELPRFGGALLAQGFLIGDGDYMLILGPESAESAKLAGFISTDGMNWDRLTFSGQETDLVIGVWNESSPAGVAYLAHAWLATPQGVIASGYNGNSVYWFGDAVRTARLD